MTADSPRDYSPEAEGPRDICANLAQIFRDYEAEGRAGNFPEPGWPQYASWASRLERAVQKLDAEKLVTDATETELSMAAHSIFVHQQDLDAMIQRWVDIQWALTQIVAPQAHCKMCGQSFERIDAIEVLLSHLKHYHSPWAVSPTAPPAEQDTPQ